MPLSTILLIAVIGLIFYRLRLLESRVRVLKAFFGGLCELSEKNITSIEARENPQYKPEASHQLLVQHMAAWLENEFTADALKKLTLSRWNMFVDDYLGFNAVYEDVMALIAKDLLHSDPSNYSKQDMEKLQRVIGEWEKAQQDRQALKG